MAGAGHTLVTTFFEPTKSLQMAVYVSPLQGGGHRFDPGILHWFGSPRTGLPAGISRPDVAHRPGASRCQKVPRNDTRGHVMVTPAGPFEPAVAPVTSALVTAAGRAPGRARRSGRFSPAWEDPVGAGRPRTVEALPPHHTEDGAAVTFSVGCRVPKFPPLEGTSAGPLIEQAPGDWQSRAGQERGSWPCSVIGNPRHQPCIRTRTEVGPA
jgi:hypothetical protein